MTTSCTDSLSKSVMGKWFPVPSWALQKPHDKLTDHVQLCHEYHNGIMQDKNGRITDLANATAGSSLDDFANRADSNYPTVRKHRVGS